MIRSTARHVASVHRGWSGGVRKSLGSASTSHHDTPNTHLMSSRLMSSSNPSDSQTTDSFSSGDASFPSGDASFPSDESWFKNLPSFGSQPIDPRAADAVTTTTADPAVSSAIAEEIAAFDPSWWPSDQVLLLLNWIDANAGLPCYAYTIGATTIAFRVLLFPLFVNGQVASSRMTHAQPELKSIKDELERIDGQSIDMAAQQRYKAQTVAIFRKYDFNPLSSLIAPLASMPVFMSMFFAMRNVPEVFPALLSTGGMLWFPDLTAPDPYHVMPVLSALTFLGMTEVGKEQMMASDPAKGKIMVNAFRAMAIVMVPVTMNFSSSIFVYWTVNNTWSFAQSVLLKQPSVRTYFKIWDPPKPVPGKEAGSIIDEIQKLFQKNKKDPSALAEDRVKAHNEIVEQQKMVKQRLMEKEGLKVRGGGRKGRRKN